MKRDTLAIETVAEKLGGQKGEGPGKGVKAKDVSREEVHEKPHEESQDPTGREGEGEAEIKDQDERQIGPHPLNGGIAQERGLKAHQEKPRQKEEKELLHFF